MNNKISQNEAQDAINMANKMQASGWRRAMPKRFFGAGLALIIGSMFAIYALPDPSGYIVFPILSLAIFIAIMRNKSNAYGHDLPQRTTDKRKLALFATLFVIVFFGSIYVRRAYDLFWVPILVGAGVALLVLVLAQKERQAYRAKANDVDGE